MPHGGPLVEARLAVVDDARDHEDPEAPAAGEGLVVEAARKVERLAQGFTQGMQAGGPISAGAEHLSQAISQGTQNAIHAPMFQPTEFSTPAGTLSAATSPSSGSAMAFEQVLRSGDRPGAAQAGESQFAGEGGFHCPTPRSQVTMPLLPYPTRMATERAILAGGCFWGMQDLIRKMPGVVSTRVGYTGGDVKNATYRKIGRAHV